LFRKKPRGGELFAKRRTLGIPGKRGVDNSTDDNLGGFGWGGADWGGKKRALF